jgi:hypothetical protein
MSPPQMGAGPSRKLFGQGAVQHGVCFMLAADLIITSGRRSARVVGRGDAPRSQRVLLITD